METKVRCSCTPRNLFFSSLRPHRVSIPLEPTIDTTDTQCRRLRPPGVGKMESLRKTGLVMDEWKTGESDATTSVKEASAHVCRKRRRLVASRTAAMDKQKEKVLSFLETCVVGRGLRSLLPRPAKVHQTHSGGRKSARRGCRGRRGIRGLLQREISTGVQQADRRPSAWKNVPLPDVGSTEDTSCPAAIAALQGWKHRAPPRSRDSHVRNMRTVLILEFS